MKIQRTKVKIGLFLVRVLVHPTTHNSNFSPLMGIRKDKKAIYVELSDCYSKKAKLTLLKP